MAETTAGTNPYMMVNLDYKMIDMSQVTKTHPGCLWGYLQMWLDSEGSDLIHGLMDTLMNSNLEGAVTAEGGAWLEEVGC